MYLSIQHHATAARATATTIVAAYVSKIEARVPEVGKSFDPPGGRRAAKAARGYPHVHGARVGPIGDQQPSG